MFVSGLQPHRDESFDSTTDILQGSVVMAEADALLSEFRSSFLPPFSLGVSQMSHSIFQGSEEGTRRRETDFDPNPLRHNLGNVLGNFSTTTIGSSRSSRSLQMGEGEVGSRGRSRGPTQDESLEDLEMLSFLEKYSDRLVEMVSKKVEAKSRAGVRGQADK